jgi:hypothetical protein
LLKYKDTPKTLIFKTILFIFLLFLTKKVLKLLVYVFISPYICIVNFNPLPLNLKLFFMSKDLFQVERAALVARFYDAAEAGRQDEAACAAFALKRARAQTANLAIEAARERLREAPRDAADDYYAAVADTLDLLAEAQKALQLLFPFLVPNHLQN